MKKLIPQVLFLFIFHCTAIGQNKFSHQDTLRGSITPQRSWWDLLKYELSVEPHFQSKTIHGKNTITFKALKQEQIMQIDLQLPMQIDSVTMNGKSISFKRDSNVFYLDFEKSILAGNIYSVTIKYSGKPKEAVKPPWDGGWIWKKDTLGNPWMSVACEGLGASSWFPCKDHWSDEPDQGVSLSITVPDSLTAVANGRLIKSKKEEKNFTTYTWAVTNPINNYDIIPYIGKYVHWQEDYAGEKGKLTCDYWALDYELEKAKEQFKQVPVMLKCFEHWFGPYPFYEDGYKLVQAPHLGMEHQSAVAYGNKFKNGYLGRDLSGSGWGLKWDFIIVHESGHEWFGNNITAKDPADMWIHESFTNYSETIFTTCQYGVNAGNEYVIGTRKKIANNIPVIGIYNVNREGSRDMYYKGGNLIHIIRQLIGDDEKFRMLLRGLNETFWHKTVTTKEIENYISQFSGIDCSKIFDQYLRTTQVPVLEYSITNNELSYHWTNCIEGFDMKIKLAPGKWISPTEAWKKLEGKWDFEDELKVDSNFYITVQKK